MSENRNEYFDILRGMAIIGVVAIHSSGTGLQFAESNLNFHFTVLWRNLLNFSVPMFLAISGYFLAGKIVGGSNEYFTFIKKQLPRVYIPLLLWSFLWFSISVFVNNKPIYHEFFKLLTFQSNGPYYFIAIIIQCYLLLPILSRFANKSGLVVSIIASISMTALIFYFRYYTEINLPLIIYAGNFLTWGMFFILGLYLGSIKDINMSNSLLVGLTFTFYALSCVESYALINMFHQAGNAVTAVKASSFMYSFFLIVFLFKNQGLIKSKLLKIIGDMSFGIYLSHMIPLTIISLLLSRFFPLSQEFSPVYQFGLICMITLSCVLVISIFNSVFSTKTSKWIGFK